MEVCRIDDAWARAEHDVRGDIVPAGCGLDDDRGEGRDAHGEDDGDETELRGGRQWYDTARLGAAVGPDRLEGHRRCFGSRHRSPPQRLVATLTTERPGLPLIAHDVTEDQFP